MSCARLILVLVWKKLIFVLVWRTYYVPDTYQVCTWYRPSLHSPQLYRERDAPRQRAAATRRRETDEARGVPVCSCGEARPLGYLSVAVVASLLAHISSLRKVRREQPALHSPQLYRERDAPRQRAATTRRRETDEARPLGYLSVAVVALLAHSSSSRKIRRARYRPQCGGASSAAVGVVGVFFLFLFRAFPRYRYTQDEEEYEPSRKNCMQAGMWHAHDYCCCVDNSS